MVGFVEHYCLSSLVFTGEKEFKSLHCCLSTLAVAALGIKTIEAMNLRELELGESEAEDLSGHWLSHFSDSCTSLVSLNIACLASEVSFSALERLVARSSHFRTLRLNRAVPIEKLPKLLRHASKLVEFGT
uniref:Uncharacterized protein n=1 Tax=Solanum lycopersicum TaxID=4081 RepID=A0A3Q7GSE7_SOLLC